MGTDKIHLNWQGKALWQKAIGLVQEFSDDILISSNAKLDTRI